MAEPRSQWQEELGAINYRVSSRERDAQKAEKKLKSQIVEIAKEKGIRGSLWRKLRLVYFVRFKLPRSVSLLRRVLGTTYWPK